MESVLIVCSDKALAEQLSRPLAHEKMSCLIALNGKDGYQRILQRHPSVVVLSTALPDMKIEGLLQLIRANLLTKSVPVIIVANTTASTTERELYLEAGANDFLNGPVNAEHFVSAICRILGSPRHVNREKSAEPIRSKPKPMPAEEPTPVESKPKRSKRVSLPFFKRIADVVFHPGYVFGEIEPRKDMIVAMLIAVLTPLVASLPKVISPTGTFDGWISAMSLGLMTSAIVWFATAGLLHMTLPFLGEEFSIRECLIFSGLAAIPKLFGAIMATLYAVLGRTALPSGQRDFSAGLNLIPGLPDSDWIAFASRIGLFDFWTAWLLMICVWTLVGDDDREWNATTIIVGAVALVFGALTSY
jgi:CheY-like chemotaxis protein